MKKQLSKIAFLSLVVMALAFSASAQFYVGIRPPAPVIVRVAPPSPAHVWIGEDWEWRGGQYVHVGGHWVYPPQPGFVWVPGYWRHARGGWRWYPGRWRAPHRRW